MRNQELRLLPEIEIDYTPKKDNPTIEDTLLAENHIRYSVEKYFFENHFRIFEYVEYPYCYEDFLEFKEFLVSQFSEKWAQKHYKFLN